MCRASPCAGGKIASDEKHKAPLRAHKRNMRERRRVSRETEGEGKSAREEERESDGPYSGGRVRAPKPRHLSARASTRARSRTTCGPLITTPRRSYFTGGSSIIHALNNAALFRVTLYIDIYTCIQYTHVYSGARMLTHIGVCIKTYAWGGRGSEPAGEISQHPFRDITSGCGVC